MSEQREGIAIVQALQCVAEGVVARGTHQPPKAAALRKSAGDRVKVDAACRVQSCRVQSYCKWAQRSEAKAWAIGLRQTCFWHQTQWTTKTYQDGQQQEGVRIGSQAQCSAQAMHALRAHGCM